MTREEAINQLRYDMAMCNFNPTTGEEYFVNDDCRKDYEALSIAIKSLEAWEKIDDDIASLQDMYSIGGTDTEKTIWENLQAVRKTIHEYLSGVSE